MSGRIPLPPFDADTLAQEDAGLFTVWEPRENKTVGVRLRYFYAGETFEGEARGPGRREVLALAQTRLVLAVEQHNVEAAACARA